MQDLIWQNLSLNSFQMLTCVFSLKSKSSYVSKGYSKPNNKYLKSYDPKQKSKHIIHLDTNYLYGYAMSKFLPTGVFKWIDTNEFDLNKYNKNSSKGCVSEVNLQYRKKLHKLHIDYFVALDKIETKKLLSKYQTLIIDFHSVSFGNVIKLVPKFFDKEKYVLLYKNFQLYLKLKLKL